MDLGAATDTGHVRAANEDGFYANANFAVFAVADGMGGHEHGEVASHLALAAIEERAETLSHATPTELPALLHETLVAANAAILSQAEDQEAVHRMGTTTVVGTICGDHLYFAHVGDSRLYLLRGQALSQLTHDHTRVQMMVDQGEITPEEAAIHPLRHQITRVVGSEESFSPEIASQRLQAGDVILLCTDGLSGPVPNDAIRTVLRSRRTAQQKAEALVQAALQAGGPDNVTALVVAYHRPRPLPRGIVAEQPRPLRWLLPVAAIALLAVALAVAGFWALQHPRYYISSAQDGTVKLFRRWPLLPMKGRELVAVPEVGTLTLSDARPYLEKYTRAGGTIEGGVPKNGLEDTDAGAALLKDVAAGTAAGLFQDAKAAAERKDYPGARERLTRLRALGADTAMVTQLATLISHLEQLNTIQPIAPMRAYGWP
jgi:PPM family protein phosphatase